jgi:hypothetical protein
MSKEDCRYIFKFVIVGDVGNIIIPDLKALENHASCHNLQVNYSARTMIRQSAQNLRAKLWNSAILKCRFKSGIQYILSVTHFQGR